MLGKQGTFSALTHQEGPKECIYTLRRHFAHKSVAKHPKLHSELINFDDETGLWWTENWQLWTVYLNMSSRGITIEHS